MPSGKALDGNVVAHLSLQSVSRYFSLAIPLHFSFLVHGLAWDEIFMWRFRGRLGREGPKL